MDWGTGGGLERWLDEATRGIRFGPDRRMVAEELAAHLEDKTSDPQWIFPDMTEAEARDRAISEMGNVTELGKELAKIHKPWLGWLWAVSCVLLWIAGIMLALGILVLCRLI